jgi:zinc protease
VKVVLLPKKTRGGTVTATFIARFGDEKSLFGKVAIGELTGATLMRGTKSKSRQQIQDEMDRLKAQISVSGGVNNATIHIQTTEANLAGALKAGGRDSARAGIPGGRVRTGAQAERGRNRGRQERSAGVGGAGAQPHDEQHVPARRCPLRRHADEDIEDLNKVTLDEVRSSISSSTASPKANSRWWASSTRRPC